MANSLVRKYGPIAKKIIDELGKLKQQKIIDLQACMAVKEHLIAMSKERENINLNETDPLHAMYADVQNRIVEFFEMASELPQLRKFCEKFDNANDIYMPSWPPMSPISTSFFNCWFAFDMPVGVKKETVTSIFIDISHALGVNKDFINLLEIMLNSYNGLYHHEGFDGKFVYLREIFTQKLYKTISASGYHGKQGEIWLVRLLPDPGVFYFDYFITMTSPYIIMHTGSNHTLGSSMQLSYYPINQWMDFIRRNIDSLKVKESENAHYHFMKYGLNIHYWLEYVFVAYVNHRSDMILLTGFPDRPESLPHHDVNSAQKSSPKLSANLYEKLRIVEKQSN